MSASPFDAGSQIRHSERTGGPCQTIIVAVAKTPEQQIAASDHKIQVGRNLALARESLGRKQAPFAREFGTAANKWNQWEAGIYYPDPRVLTRLCDDYGFTMDWFYRGKLAGVSDERAAGLRRVVGEKTAA